MSEPSVGRATPVSQVFEYWGNLVKLGMNTPNHVQGHMKVFQSFQLLFSHQMRLYSSVRVFCGLSYTCFSGIRVMGLFGETGPEYPKSCAGTYEK